MTMPSPTLDPPPRPVPREPIAGPAGSMDLPPFETVLATHEIEVYRYLRRLSATAEDAADLHQETFLRAYAAYGRLTPDANVRAWLYRIAGNLARDAFRRRAARPATAPASTETETIAAAGRSDPEAALAASELRAAVRRCLLELGWRQRTAVVARVLDGLEYPDVAALLECTETTARQHVSQGLRRLRGRLAELEVGS